MVVLIPSGDLGWFIFSLTFGSEAHVLKSLLKLNLESRKFTIIKKQWNLELVYISENHHFAEWFLALLKLNLALIPDVQGTQGTV